MFEMFEKRSLAERGSSYSEPRKGSTVFECERGVPSPPYPSLPVPIFHIFASTGPQERKRRNSSKLSLLVVYLFAPELLRIQTRGDVAFLQVLVVLLAGVFHDLPLGVQEPLPDAVPRLRERLRIIDGDHVVDDA